MPLLFKQIFNEKVVWSATPRIRVEFKIGIEIELVACVRVTVEELAHVSGHGGVVGHLGGERGNTESKSR